MGAFSPGHLSKSFPPIVSCYCLIFVCACCCSTTVPRSWIGVTLRLRDFLPRFLDCSSGAVAHALEGCCCFHHFLVFFSFFYFSVFSTNKSLVVTCYRFLLFLCCSSTYVLAPWFSLQICKSR